MVNQATAGEVRQHIGFADVAFENDRQDFVRVIVQIGFQLGQPDIESLLPGDIATEPRYDLTAVAEHSIAVPIPGIQH